jgi:ABC-type nitrate/sulfonate/bicarbonate transport system substrate-binding protein
MSEGLDRRAFLRQAIGAASWSLAIPLFAACAPAAAPGPTAVPAPKPTEAPKPAEAAKPTEVAKPAEKAAAPAAPANVTKLTYAMVTYSPYHIVPIVTSEKPELMRKFGLELDIVVTNNSPNSVNAMVGGSVHAAGVTPESAWPAQAQTPDVQQIAALANGTPYQLFVNPDIKQVADLKGKSVGASATRGGADTTAMQILLLENGLNEGDYSIVQVGPIAERTAAMKAGTISGCAQQEPQSTQLREAGFVELDDADNYPALKNVQTLVLISRKSWYEANPEVALGFLRAWIDITRWVYDPKNKDELLAIIAKTLKVEQKAAENAYQRWWIKTQTAPLAPRVDLKMAEQHAENQKKVGNTNVPSDFAKLVDNSLVEKALA